MRFPMACSKPAPHLPACGLNDNASRTWVDFHEADGSLIYGFCGLSDSDDLDGIWFATPRGEVPPHEVFVTLTDREDGVVYSSNTVATLPSPILELKGTEYYDTAGGEFTQYEFTVTNRDAFPDGLFEASPHLPACGLNNDASRTWVDFHDATDGSRINGFCAMSDSEDLDGIWIAVERGEAPPERVVMTMTDRETGFILTSNAVEPLVAGDSNRDSVFDSSDLVQVFALGQYEDAIASNSTWESGDWNRDGEFDSRDLIYAMQLGTYLRPSSLQSVAASAAQLRDETTGPKVSEHAATDAVFDQLSTNGLLMSAM